MEEHIKELAHYAKKKLLASKASDVVIGVGKINSTQIKFVDNKIIKTETQSAANMSIFFVKDKRIIRTVAKDVGASSYDDAVSPAQMNVRKHKIDNMVKNCLKFAKYVEPKKDYHGIATGPFKYRKPADIYDPRIEHIGEKQIDLVFEGVDAALKEGAKRCSGICDTHTAETFLLTSGNVEAYDKDTALYYSIRAFLEKNASGHMNCSERTLKCADISGAGEFAGTIAKNARNPVSWKPGKYDIIFAPLAFGIFLDHIGGATSMFDIEAGFSYFKDKLNKNVAEKFVNIYDDATLPGGLNSTPFDSEGSPTQRTPLVENGILKNYLFNTSLARKYKTKTTGNAGLTSPTPWNVILSPGKFNREELFEEAKDGLYVTNLWYTRFQNMFTGDFSTIPRDGIFLIKNGKIYKSLKDLRIRDSMLNILKNIKAVANDTKQIYSWEVGTPVFTPHVLVKNVGVTMPTK